MRTDYQLVSAVPDRFRQEIGQNQLILRTQAVFRLVQQAQGIHLNLALEEHDCVFSVGPFPQAFPGFIFDKAAFGLASGLVDPVQMIKVVQGFELEFFTLQCVIVFRQFFPFAVDPFID